MSSGAARQTMAAQGDGTGGGQSSPGAEQRNPGEGRGPGKGWGDPEDGPPDPATGGWTFVRIHPAEIVTLAGLALACLGLASAVNGDLTPAIAWMLMAMLADMLDGPIARRTHGATDFGRQLDSFVDVFIYLALPMAILYRLGLGGGPWRLALLVYIAAGLLRLSYFNLVGTVAAGGAEYHVGLPVIWSQLLVVLAFPLWWWAGPAARWVVGPALVAMSVLMINPRRFRKLTWYLPQAVLILVIAALYAWLAWQGVTSP